MRALQTSQAVVEIFDDGKLYGQPEFTAKGCGGKTKWWAHIKNGDFPVIEVGRLKKATGKALNAYFASKSNGMAARGLSGNAA